MVGIGIGIGIGFNAAHGVQSPCPQQLIDKAIKERNHVIATLGGVNVVIQPYALARRGSSITLIGVIVYSAGDTAPSWTIVETNISDLSVVKPYDLAFFPNGAFDPSDWEGVIVAVEPINPFDDTVDVPGNGD